MPISARTSQGRGTTRWGLGHFVLCGQRSDSESDSEFEISDDDLSDGDAPKKRRRSAPKRQNNEEPANEQWRMPTDDELLNLCTQQAELNMLKEQRA